MEVCEKLKIPTFRWRHKLWRESNEKKGWKEWRWINPFPCRLDGANSCWSCHHEKASSSQLGVTFLVGWGDPSFKCQSWRPTAPPSLQSIPVSGVLSTSSLFFLQSEIRYMGFLIIGNLCKMSAKSNLKWKFASELISFEYCWFNNAFKWYFPLRDQTPNVYINHYI